MPPPAPATAPSPTLRTLVPLAGTGMLLFVAMAVGIHALRPDLDGWDAQMSRYLLPPHGGWLQAAYCGLAVAIVAIGLGLRRSLAPQARSAAPLLLFAAGAVALATTAFAPMDLDGADPSLAGWVHGVSAQAAFLCVSVAMLLQSAWLRADPRPRWHGRFPLALGVAALAFAVLWTLLLVPGLPRGAAQKAAIATIALWFLLAWGWLRRELAAGEGAA
ncbi:DUF998 domain-containing protein [Luteimonas huabeiensis]|uniref:DUF998 domain-containing protein n=1 Tax=Luteimonas huabeiensis TaxID=1244513 RepID=UPI000464991F|nr:DUF998 domain-containing protein [Luteimonas huabeiensis]